MEVLHASACLPYLDLSQRQLVVKSFCWCRMGIGYCASSPHFESGIYISRRGIWKPRCNQRYRSVSVSIFIFPPIWSVIARYCKHKQSRLLSACWFRRSSLLAYSGVCSHNLNLEQDHTASIPVSNSNYLLTIFDGVLVFGRFVLSIADYGRIAHFKTFQQLSADFRIVRAVNVLSVAADGAIALTLVSLLHRLRSGYRQTDTLINKLIVYTINTSLITNVCSVGSLVSTIAWPHSFIFIFFFFSFSRSRSACHHSVLSNWLTFSLH